MAPTDPWPDGGDDTNLDYHDTPVGNIWRPDNQPRDETRCRCSAAASPAPNGRAPTRTKGASAASAARRTCSRRCSMRPPLARPARSSANSPRPAARGLPQDLAAPLHRPRPLGATHPTS